MERPGDPFPPPPAPTFEYCYRHPTEPTRVHCTRCDRAICPECMIPAPVGHQCPECVQQARREFRQGPGRQAAIRGITATKVLVAAILGVFVLELVSAGAGSVGSITGERLLRVGALQPYLVADGDIYRLFTAMFLHFGLFHIAFNAWALWVFGGQVERDYGTTRFVLIYFVSGFVASATSYAFGPATMIGAGASGAIFGVFGAFVAYNYRRRHLAFHSANLRSAALLLLINALFAFTNPAIDWRAHLGGFVAGVAAGFVAEGWGDRAQRRLITTIGFVVLAGIGVALVLWRTAQLQAQPEYQQAVEFFRLLAG